ncbi:MAG: sulfatase-like hydrolase/transferase, partial [Planctomycetia bacterium]|nr:sulfatase-like hydrolase/transferase [Planctomycetia bacterium]
DWPQQQKAHAAMISRMDADVGRLMDLIKRLGIDNNTLVFFSSDNGPLQGIKRDLAEGGIRVPFIARWPGKIAPRVSHFVGGFQDMMPTMAELAGSSDAVPKDIDGLSIVPTLLNEPSNQKPHEYLYWTFYERGGGQAIRVGDWKAIQQPMDSALRLYDLSKDLSEEHDVAAQHPDVVARLKAMMKAAYTPHPNWKMPGEK